MRFHQSIYFEDGAVFEIKEIIKGLGGLERTNHFKEKRLPSPTKNELLNGFIFEYRKERNKISRFCIRVPKKDYDVTYVITNKGVIITSYITAKGDYHKTMNKKLYVGGF